MEKREIVERTKSILISQPEILSSLLFGSIAEEVKREGSDVDIALFFIKGRLLKRSWESA